MKYTGVFLLLSVLAVTPSAIAAQHQCAHADVTEAIAPDTVPVEARGVSESMTVLWQSSGIANMGWQNLVMILIGLVLIFLAIVKKFEPLLLLPIGFGGVLANIPVANIAALPVVEALVQQVGAPATVTTTILGGFLGQIYAFGIATGLFPLLIFIGVGAMTDFGPMIANPKTAFLGAAAQIGIFGTILGALALSEYVPVINFSLKDAASIGIIGGADGPTAIFLASRLSPDLLGAIAVAAYSYMALVPIIQPPIMRLLTTKNERLIPMKQLRPVSKRERIIFPLAVLLLVSLFIPDAAPLIGALMFGNLIKESGVVDRLSKTAQNELINIVTILLGLAVGSKLAADAFLRPETLGILMLGLIAFSCGTAGGVLLAKFMNLFMKDKFNPLIGAAGVSAVPMAARVVNKVGIEYDPHNFLLMHAMGPNVAGVIGSAIAAGVLLAILG
ncbi:MAG: sodium ion-translocating decarboxylase subunit beta [Chitinispirillaceae bacterium]|nr:sodium ion-translocating decarboxylase subunit beta [Chitinispirillaceae bacterium]